MNALSKSILVVEDDPLQATMVSSRLRKRGYATTIAHSGEDALEKVVLSHFNLILMDIDLGQGMDGTQTALKILKNHNLPIVFLSSHTEPEIVEKVKNITRYGYIVKNTGDFVLFSGIEMAMDLFQAHQDLEKNLHQFKQISDNISEIFWIEDVAEKRILYITPSYEKVFGQSAKDLYDNPHSFLNAILPEDRDRVLEHYIVFLKTQNSTRLEYRIQNQSGSIRWISVRYYTIEKKQETITKLVGFAEDITHLKNQSMALESRDRLLRTIFHSIPLPSVFISTEFSILDWNKASADIFGYSKEEILGKNIFEYITPREEQDKLIYLSDELMEGNGIVHKINWNRKKNGEKFLCEWFNTPVYDENGMILGIVAIAQDITERKKTFDGLSLKLNQKEILLKEIHHRVKNNMATICSLLEIQAFSSEDENTKTQLLDAKGRVYGMMLLYDKLFRSSNYKRTSISNYLTSLLKEMSSIKRTGSIIIHSDIEDRELDTSILFPIGIIVNELVSNSLKYAFEGLGKGMVSLHGAYQPDKGSYILIIRDNGVGWMAREPKHKSTGFGLELVDILTKQIGGSCERDEKNRDGVSYTIEFPIPA